MVSRALRAVRRAIGLGNWPNGGIVLAYHRVATPARDPHLLCVDPARFADHLDVIGERAAVLPLAQMVERAAAGTLPLRSVALTFDDGYRDVLRAAAPMLAARNLPATVFVSTGAVDSGGSFWWDDSREGNEPLTPDEVVELSRVPGITIGSHTRSHRALALLPPAEQREEIVSARHRLESLTGKTVAEFAYPFGGARDVSDETVRVARETGIALACTTAAGGVRRGVDRHRVPRMIVRNWTRQELLDRL